MKRNLNKKENKDGPGFAENAYGEEPDNRRSNVKSINLSGGEWVIVDGMTGVYCEGVQFYDLINVGYISNSGMMRLIDLLSSLSEHGISVQFVNVSAAIKKRIRFLGLNHFLICS